MSSTSDNKRGSSEAGLSAPSKVAKKEPTPMDPALAQRRRAGVAKRVAEAIEFCDASDWGGWKDVRAEWFYRNWDNDNPNGYVVDGAKTRQLVTSDLNNDTPRVHALYRRTADYKCNLYFDGVLCGLYWCSNTHGWRTQTLPLSSPYGSKRAVTTEVGFDKIIAGATFYIGNAYKINTHQYVTLVVIPASAHQRVKVQAAGLELQQLDIDENPFFRRVGVPGNDFDDNDAVDDATTYRYEMRGCIWLEFYVCLRLTSVIDFTFQDALVNVTGRSTTSGCMDD